MDPFAVSHFSDDALLHDLRSGGARDCTALAVRLTRIAEVERRNLHLREGYPSMAAYCMHELHLSDDAAWERIKAARTVRQFPAVLVALADGRLHLRAVLMLARRLTSGNADELVAAATHKTRIEIEQLLAERFPQPDLPERLQAIPAPSPIARTAPAQEDQLSHGTIDATRHSAAPTVTDLSKRLGTSRVNLTIPDRDAHGHVEVSLPLAVSQLGPARVESPAPRARMTPLAPERFGLQVTIDQETHDLLQHVRDLMSHEVPTGELALVLKGALKLAAAQLEKRKFAATTCPRAGAKRSAPANGTDTLAASRHIPAAVKRAVRERDGARCTFVSDTGRRCESRTRLEYDHIEPVARGGETTATNVQLRCRAHNAYAAERAFGSEFMSAKHAEAKARAAARNLATARMQPRRKEESQLRSH